jgi:hypothetical protein
VDAEVRAVFLSSARSPAELPALRLLIESLRTFGGVMDGYPVWIFAVECEEEIRRGLAGLRVEVIPLPVPEPVGRYPFGAKVLACARADARAQAGIRSLVWLDPECLVVQPPVLFSLEDRYDAALRPVHIQNAGSGLSDPLDEVWKGVYTALGIGDVVREVESFVDRRSLRAYYNSHGLSVNPARGLFRRWQEVFGRLIRDEAFQATACQDAVHRIFLFQAAFSALIASSLEERRIRLLPPTYNYPYNLQQRVPEERRAAALNDLVCFTYEGRDLQPDAVTDVEIRPPLRSWLEARLPSDIP